MPVSTTTLDVTYDGNGSTVDFPFSFPIPDDDDLIVTQIDVGGDRTVLTKGTHYTVSGAGSANGGTVTMLTAPIAGYQLEIVRELDLTQPYDPRVQGAFSTPSLAAALDRQAMIAQQVQDAIDEAGYTAYVESYVTDVIAAGSGVVPEQWNLAGDGATTEFNLASPACTAADPRNYLVTINGLTKRATSDYTISLAASTITFTSAPAAAAVISVRQLTYQRTYAAADNSTILSVGSSTVRSLSARFGERVNVKDYGAVGDGVADDYAAFVAAIAACTAGRTLYIPAGKYRIRSALVINKAINVVGDGPQSCIWVDILLNPTTTIGVTFGSAFSGGYTNVDCVHESFSIMGPTGSCLYAVAYLEWHQGEVWNVHVKPGSVSHPVVVAGCLESKFQFVTQNNFGAAYYSGTGTWAGGAINVKDLRTWTGYPGGAVLPTNACHFDLYIAGSSSGGGVVQEAQDQSGGNNTFRGTVQGLLNAAGSAVKGAGWGFYFEGGNGWTVEKCHVEGTLHGSRFSGSQFAIRDTRFSPVSGLTGEKLTLLSASKGRIDRVSGTFDFGPDTSSYIDCVDCDGVILPVSNYTKSVDTIRIRGFRYSGSAIYGQTGLGDAPGGNLLANGNFARGTAGHGNIGGAPTTYAVTTGTRFGTHAQSLQVAHANSTRFFSTAIADWAQQVGQPVCLWMWVKNNSPRAMQLGINHQGAYNLMGIAPGNDVEAGWVLLAMTFVPQSGGTQANIILRPVEGSAWAGTTAYAKHAYVTNGGNTYRCSTPGISASSGGPTGSGSAIADGTCVWEYVANSTAHDCYIGEVGACIGLNPPAGQAPYSGSFDESIQIGAVRQEVGSAAPLTGAHIRGDIVWNSAPASGGFIGWSCITSGTPGIWSTFGPIT